MNKKIIICLSILAILIISICVKLDEYAQESFKNRNVDNSPSALIDILGELRYTAAAILWMKTDYYQHEYEYSGKDFRTNEPIMPLIRLITLLDPHFIQAYDFGAYHLAVNLKKKDESMKFLKEGITNNPDAFELNWEYGFLLYIDKKYSESLPYLTKARTLRNQKTPVYDDWIKMIWVNSRIADTLKKLGKSEEAEPYLNEMEAYKKACNEENLERAELILNNPIPIKGEVKSK